MQQPQNNVLAIPKNHAIICRDVHKWYEGFHAVRGVTTTVMRNEVVVLIGPSGSGKSTFLRTLNRLERHERGDVIVDGIALTDDVRNIDAVRRGVGMVSQSFTLFPHMKVRENVALAPRRVLKINRQDADEAADILLNRVNMLDHADKMPHQLSAGEQQRVAIARALAMRPRIMLFDEPTSALDAEMVKEVLDIVRQLVREEMTIVAITHEMDFAREIAHRVIMMDEGQIVEERPPDEMFNNPRNRRTQRFLEKVL